jgi:hypothetical protein
MIGESFMNNHHKISFKLDERVKIEIDLEVPLNEIDCCYQEYIAIFIEGNKHLLALEPIKFLMLELSDLLKKGLENQLCLNQSIIDDLGFYWNECFQSYSRFVSKSSSCYKIAQSYLLWSSRCNMNPMLDTWIYNNNHKEIILEITPSYPWHFSDLEDISNKKDDIPYEEWIKNYKPLLIRTIPKDVAEQWLHQAQEILKNIEKNTARLHAQETFGSET